MDEYPGVKTWLDTPESFEYQRDSERERILYATLQDTLAQNEQAMDSLGLDDFIPKLYERNDNFYPVHLQRK